MFWLLPRLMIITGTESYFLNSNLAGHCLDLQPLFRPSIRRFFLRLLWTAVYFAYIPKFIATQQTFDVFIPHLKTRRLFGADVQLRKYCITKQDSALFGLFKSYFIQGLFSWRNEDPNTKKIPEVGSSSQRHMFSEFSLHANERIIFCLALAPLEKNF